MIKNKKVTAIILSAGKSERYGKDKNYEKINGKTILEYSLNAFVENKYIDDIILVIKPGDEAKIDFEINKKVSIIYGGETRGKSVFSALLIATSDIVIIHDGARPMVRKEDIENVLNAMGKYKGATIGVKSKDTVKIADKNNIVTSTTNRNNTWLIQTPQCFDRNTLFKVYEKRKEYNFTDDCALLEKEEHEIKIIEGDYSNIKITTKIDYDLLTLLLNNNI